MQILKMLVGNAVLGAISRFLGQCTEGNQEIDIAGIILNAVALIVGTVLGFARNSMLAKLRRRPTATSAGLDPSFIHQIR